jgi:hypothetical protein
VLPRANFVICTEMSTVTENVVLFSIIFWLQLFKLLLLQDGQDKTKIQNIQTSTTIVIFYWKNLEIQKYTLATLRSCLKSLLTSDIRTYQKYFRIFIFPVSKWVSSSVNIHLTQKKNINSWFSSNLGSISCFVLRTSGIPQKRPKTKIENLDFNHILDVV